MICVPSKELLTYSTMNAQPKLEIFKLGHLYALKTFYYVCKQSCFAILCTSLKYVKANSILNSKLVHYKFAKQLI